MNHLIQIKATPTAAEKLQALKISRSNKRMQPQNEIQPMTDPGLCDPLIPLSHTPGTGSPLLKTTTIAAVPALKQS